MSGIRVTAGRLRGRRIALPPGPVRPTSSRAREAVFNILAAEIAGSRFLDLFAGTGIMAIEALSRGASEALAVDSSGRAIASIGATAKDLALPLKTRRTDALKFLLGKERDQPFNLVYADPPYDYEDYETLVKALDESPLIASGAVVAVEHRRKNDLVSGTSLTRMEHRDGRSWGQVTVEFFDIPDRS